VDDTRSPAPAWTIAVGRLDDKSTTRVDEIPHSAQQRRHVPADADVPVQQQCRAPLRATRHRAEDVRNDGPGPGPVRIGDGPVADVDAQGIMASRSERRDDPAGA
jgi:hypothetical protein